MFEKGGQEVMDHRSLLTFWSWALQCLYLMEFSLFSQLGKLLNSVLSYCNLLKLVRLRGHAFLILIKAITCVCFQSMGSESRVHPSDLVNNGALTQDLRSVLLFQCSSIK